MSQESFRSIPKAPAWTLGHNMTRPIKIKPLRSLWINVTVLVVLSELDISLLREKKHWGPLCTLDWLGKSLAGHHGASLLTGWRAWRVLLCTNRQSSSVSSWQWRETLQIDWTRKTQMYLLGVSHPFLQPLKTKCRELRKCMYYIA